MLYNKKTNLFLTFAVVLSNLCTAVPILPGRGPVTPCNKFGCELLADKHGLPFTSVEKSDSDPPGCIRYDDGRVAWVDECAECRDDPDYRDFNGLSCQYHAGWLKKYGMMIYLMGSDDQGLMWWEVYGNEEIMELRRKCPETDPGGCPAKNTCRTKTCEGCTVVNAECAEQVQKAEGSDGCDVHAYREGDWCHCRGGFRMLGQEWDGWRRKDGQDEKPYGGFSYRYRYEMRYTPGFRCVPDIKYNSRKCANYGETCSCTGTVIYGAESSGKNWNWFRTSQNYVVKAVDGAIQCTNAALGDPSYDEVPDRLDRNRVRRKACFCMNEKRCDNNATKEGDWCKCKNGWMVKSTSDISFGKTGIYRPYGDFFHRYLFDNVGYEGFECSRKVQGEDIAKPLPECYQDFGRNSCPSPAPIPVPSPTTALPDPTLQPGCQTVDLGIQGAIVGHDCVFPFTYDGFIYNSCADVGGIHGEHGWCAFDKKYIPGRWGSCSDAKACPRNHGLTKECVDTDATEDNWATHDRWPSQFKCSHYEGKKHLCGLDDNVHFDAAHMCCACKPEHPGLIPTPMPTPEPTKSPTPMPTPAPTPAPTRSPTAFLAPYKTGIEGKRDCPEGYRHIWSLEECLEAANVLQVGTQNAPKVVENFASTRYLGDYAKISPWCSWRSKTDRGIEQVLFNPNRGKSETDLFQGSPHWPHGAENDGSYTPICMRDEFKVVRNRFQVGAPQSRTEYDKEYCLNYGKCEGRRSPEDCKRECKIAGAWCKAFNYDKKWKTCELFNKNVDFFNNPRVVGTETLGNSSERDYYELVEDEGKPSPLSFTWKLVSKTHGCDPADISLGGDNLGNLQNCKNACEANSECNAFNLMNGYYCQQLRHCNGGATKSPNGWFPTQRPTDVIQAWEWTQYGSRKNTPRYTPAPRTIHFQAKVLTESHMRYVSEFVVETIRSMQNWGACPVYCERNIHCLSWTWRDEVCYLLGEYLPLSVTKRGEYSGVPKRNGSDDDYRVAGPQYCRGFNGKVLQSKEHKYFESESACRTLCDNTFTCTGYHWLKSNTWRVPYRHKCTIYTAPSTFTYHEHMVRTVSNSNEPVGKCYAKRFNAGGSCGWWYSCDGFKDTGRGGRRLIDGEVTDRDDADMDFEPVDGPEVAAEMVEKLLRSH